MAREYYELEDDLSLEGRWHLDRLFDRTGIEFDSREFTYGNRFDLDSPLRLPLWNEEEIIEVRPPLRVSVHTEGTALDFTYSAEDMPIVTTEVGRMLGKLASADIQRIPVWVERREQGHEILNVAARIDCIDTERSEIEWWEEGNVVRPDLAGKPHAIPKLVIDPNRVGECDMFRLEGWDLVIIVSDVLKKAFQDAEISGIKFRKVSP